MCHGEERVVGTKEDGGWIWREWRVGPKLGGDEVVLEGSEEDLRGAGGWCWLCGADDRAMEAGW